MIILFLIKRKEKKDYRKYNIKNYVPKSEIAVPLKITLAGLVPTKKNELKRNYIKVNSVKMYVHPLYLRNERRSKKKGY